jgi:predicted acylesterase/phospholipase RssA
MIINKIFFLNNRGAKVLYPILSNPDRIVLKKDYRRSEPETVLILNGRDSLGAYECGVYKTLVKHSLKFDIIAGTSIGAVDAAILTSAGAGSEQYDDHVNSKNSRKLLVRYGS